MNRKIIVVVLVSAVIGVLINPGCSSSGLSMPSLVPKKEPAGGGMLGLAMNDFFQKLKEGRKNINDIDTYYLKLPEEKHWQAMQKWQGILTNAYDAYHDYGMALYNYSAFKDGSPIDRAPFVKKAAEVARVGQKALPEMLAVIPRMAELRNRAFHRLDGENLKSKYSLATWNYTKPLVEYPIDPLEELRTRKRTGKALYEYFLEGEKESKKVDITDKKAVEHIYFSWADEILYPYEMLIRECRWLLSFVHEHDLAEACSIVMEIESRLPEVRNIAEKLWKKVGGRERATKLNKRLSKKDLFHKREYVLTRHFEREKKKLQISEEEIQKYYTAFKRKREELKEIFGYEDWPGKDLPVKQGIDNDTLNNASTGPVGRSPVVVWESAVKIKRTEKGLVSWRHIRWAYTHIVVIWGETSAAAQSYLAEYLTRPFTKDEHQVPNEIMKPTNEVGNLSFVQRYSKNQRDELIGNVRFIRNNILVMVERYGMPADKFINLVKVYDKVVKEKPIFKPEKRAYKNWFKKLSKEKYTVKINGSVQLKLPSSPSENLQVFCLDLDTHGYVMEKEGKYTYHGWEPGQGEIAIGLINKEGGEILRYEKIRVEVIK